MHENETARIVVDSAYHVHVAFGPGLLESIYQRALEHELRLRKVAYRSEVPVNAVYKGLVIDPPYRVDLLVNDHLVVELKSVERVKRVHMKQLLTYLKLTDTRLGLLINFGAPTIKKGVSRVVNGLPE